MANIQMIEFPHSCMALAYKNFQESFSSDIKVSSTESGIELRRLRRCFARRAIQITYISCNKECKNELVRFYKDDTLFGVKWFLWIDPCSQKKVRVRFTSEIRFKPLDPCFENFEITFNLEEICRGNSSVTGT